MSNRLDTLTIERLTVLLTRPDPADLHGHARYVGRVTVYGREEVAVRAGQSVRRGNRITQLGAPDRRSSEFLPLVTRWAQHHYMMREGLL